MKKEKRLSALTVNGIRRRYEHACNSYAHALCMAFGIDAKDCCWLDGKVGGAYCLCEIMTLDMEDVIYCVENGVTFDDYADWQRSVAESDVTGIEPVGFSEWHARRNGTTSR